MKIALRIALFVLIVAGLSSCVGNKQIVLFQDLQTDTFLIDSIVNRKVESVLKSGDVVYIKFEKFRLPEDVLSVATPEAQTRNFQVNNPYLLGNTIDFNGKLSHVIFGEINASGKTVLGLQSELQQKAHSLYPGSSVNVFLLSGTVSILGEVARPGRYSIYNSRNSVLDVLAVAGDFAQYADRKSVRVIRDIDGVSSVIHLDLTSVEVLKSKCFYLQNEDVVIVSPLERKKLATANIQWLVSSVTALVAVASLLISINR